MPCRAPPYVDHKSNKAVLVCPHERNPLIHGADAATMFGVPCAQAQRSDDLLAGAAGGVHRGVAAAGPFFAFALLDHVETVATLKQLGAGVTRPFSRSVQR